MNQNKVILMEKPLEVMVMPYQVSFDGTLRLVFGVCENLLNHALETYAHSTLTKKKGFKCWLLVIMQLMGF